MIKVLQKNEHTKKGLIAHVKVQNMDKSNRCQNPITNETLKAPDFSIFPMPHSTPMNTNNLKTFQIHNFALKKKKKSEEKMGKT